MGSQSRKLKMAKSSSFFKILKSKTGMSIIEVLIALGMVGILASVLASVLAQMQKAQNLSNVINTIESMRTTIQKLVADGTAWRQTVLVNGGGVLACVQTNAACTASYGPSAAPPSPIPDSDETVSNAVLDAAPLVTLPTLEQAAGAAYIDTTAATSGYTDRGTPCNTWAAGGNNDCPIRWVIKTGFECQGAATCLNPTIRVVAVLYYRRADQANPVNERKYRVDIRRGAKGDTRSERFLAEYIQPACGVGCTPASPQNGGACTSAGVAIPFNNVGTILNENANVTDGGGGLMNFNAGTYNCTAQSTCFACGKVRLGLQIGGAIAPNHFSVQLLSNPWQQTQVSLNNVTFTVNAVTPVRVIEFCETDPGGLLALSNINLGMAMPDYSTQTKFAEIQCTRIF